MVERRRGRSAKGRWRTPVSLAVALLAASFLVSAVCFGVAAADYGAYGVDADAQALLTRATAPDSPLRTLHTRLRRLDVLAALMVGDQQPAGYESPGLKLEEERKAIDAQLTAYLATPAFPSEVPHRKEAKQAWLHVQQALVTVRAAKHGPSGAALKALIEVFRPAMDALDTELSHCASANDIEAGQHAHLISAAWARDRALSLLLAIVGAGLSIAAAIASRRRTTVLIGRAEESMDFAGRVAHDVLGPLSPIRMFFGLARSRGLSHPALQSLLPSANAALSRLVETVDALLAFAEAGGQRSSGTAVLAEVARGVIDDAQPLAADLGVEVTLADLPRTEVACAPGILSSVLSNLLRNAIKHMGATTVRRVQIVARREGSEVRVEVQDTGPGIAPEWQGRIFEPMQRIPHTSVAGIGLGLATVRRLVLSHGGRLGLSSRPGEGACFWFTLPAAQVEARLPVALESSSARSSMG